MLAANLPPAADPEHGILMCGPPGLKQQAALPNLLRLGYTREQILDF